MRYRENKTKKEVHGLPNQYNDVPQGPRKAKTTTTKSEEGEVLQEELH